MGLLSTISRLVRGKSNELNDAIEERNMETIVNQSVRDMKNTLTKQVQAVAKCLAEHKRLESRYQGHLDQVKTWEERAILAVDNGNDELARKALEKKREEQASADQLKASVEQSQQTVERLKAQTDELRRKIEEAERNKATLIARHHAAQAQKKAAQAAAGLDDGKDAMSVMTRFEDKIQRDESSAAAFQEMGEGTSGVANADLEAQFAQLGSSSSADDELAALKAARSNRQSGEKSL